MNDLEIAKKLLIEKQLTLVIVKNGKTLFETRGHGISGFLNAIEKLGKTLECATVADKVAGKAVALLCVYAGIAAVYAEVLSTKAKGFFDQNGVVLEWRELVDNILDDKKQDMCPFEKEATSIPNPKEAYDRFKTLLQNMKPCR